jgi:hypothetical protein
MKASPLILMLEALMEMVEQRLDQAERADREDIVLIGKQLHRLNGVYITLVETMVESGRR